MISCQLLVVTIWNRIRQEHLKRAGDSRWWSMGTWSRLQSNCKAKWPTKKEAHKSLPRTGEWLKVKEYWVLIMATKQQNSSRKTKRPTGQEARKSLTRNCQTRARMKADTCASLCWQCCGRAPCQPWPWNTCTNKQTNKVEWVDAYPETMIDPGRQSLCCQLYENRTYGTVSFSHSITYHSGYITATCDQ